MYFRWWPIQAWFWLEWGSSTAGQVFQPRARVFAPSIPTRSLRVLQCWVPMSRVRCETCRSAAKLRFVRMAFIPPRCHPERSEGPMYFRWWPIQAWFWLEWGSSTAGQSLPAARSRFRAVHSDSISTRPLLPGARYLAFFARRGKVKQKLKLPRIERGSAACMISMCGLRKSGSGKCDTCNRNPVKRGLDKEPGE